MTRKIICLLLAMFCLVTVFASCNKDAEPAPETDNETEVVCEAHADADKNLYCDTCQIPMHTVIEKVPTEEQVVETIVSVIPSDATIASIYNCATEEELVMPTGAVLIDNWNYSQDALDGSNIYYIRYVEIDDTDPENVKYSLVTKVYNVATGKDVIPEKVITYTDDEPANTEYTVNFIRNEMGLAFAIETYTYTSNYSEIDGFTSTSSTALYTLSGASIVSIEPDVSPSVEVGGYNYTTELSYITVDGIKYAISTETQTVVYSENADKFVERPEFDEVVGDYGYVIDSTRVLVYDLTKWLNCVYCYEIPESRIPTADVFVLANSNVLVQSMVRVPNSSVNYDILVDGDKYDIHYTVVDVAAKSASDVEFGYYVEDVEINEDVYASAVKNCITARTIANKDFNDTVLLLTDDALKILAEDGALMPDAKITSFELVAKNRFVATIVYGEGSITRHIYDEKGAYVATVPDYAYISATYIELNGKFYDFDMNLILDPAASEMIVNYYGNGYITLLNSDYDAFYWAAGMSAPTLIADLENVPEDPESTDPSVYQTSYAREDYFVVFTQTEGAEETTISYKLYNTKNQLVLDCGELDVISVLEVDGVYTIMLDDGSVYVAK